MRALHPKINMDTLCRLFGYTRQAYYQLQKYDYRLHAESQIIIEMVQRERQILPNIGGRKLLSLITESMKRENITIGRDAFFALLKENRLLVRYHRFKVKTTDSRHRFRRFPNLIRELVPIRPHELWVSDITYIETKEGYLYLSLVTDAYSRKIVGWNLSYRLDAEGALSALTMALDQLPLDRPLDLIHHSDRGIQYCSDKYISILQSSNVAISMTENGDPLENALAERVNGILKTEWLYHKVPSSKQEALNSMTDIINAYNSKRPHLSIGMLTPNVVHQGNVKVGRMWKNYYKSKNTDPP